MADFNDTTPPENVINPPKTTLPADQLQSGSGRNAFRVDHTGMWLGDEDPDKAPFHVDMDGNFTIRSTAAGGASMKIETENLQITMSDGKTDRILIGL